MKTPTPLRLLLPILLSILLSTQGRALAAKAAFSSDGGHVFLLRGSLIDLDLASGKCVKIALPQNSDISALARAANGELALLTAKRIYLFNPATKECKEQAVEPGDGYEFKDLAWNPADCGLYIVASGSGEAAKPDKLICLVKELLKAVPLVTRRIDVLDTPAFDSKGRFFFAVRGDLWGGGIDYDPTIGSAPKGDTAATTRTIQLPISIHADRIAPLARLESYNGSPSATGVYEIAATDSQLAVHTHRLGGSGWGKVLLLDKPAADLPHKDGEYQDFAKTLASVKILGENGTAAYLCATPGGKIFYRAMPLDPRAEMAYWLQEPNAAPKKIELTDKALEEY